MSFLGDIGGDEPNRNHERELQRVIFIQIEDTGYGISSVGWRYREESEDLATESNRLFDTLDEAVQEYLESRSRRDNQ